jgi:hypothetical protein
MANTKISQLPLYTGNTYNGYVIWNNSGETTTYKIKETNSFVNRLEVFRNVGDTNNISNELAVIIIGKNNTSSQDKYSLILGEDNNVNGVGAPGSQGSIVNGLGNTIGTFGYGSLVFGGYNNIQAPGNFVFGNNGSVSGGGNLTRGEQNNITGGVNVAWGDYITINCNYAQSFGLNNDITTTTAYQGIYGGENNLISSTGGNNFIFGSKASTISGTSQFVSLIGLSGFTSPTEDNTTYVDNFQVINKVVLRNYATLDYADDAAAAAGGIVLGGVYHTSGALKIRVT